MPAVRRQQNRPQDSPHTISLKFVRQLISKFYEKKVTLDFAVILKNFLEDLVADVLYSAMTQRRPRPISRYFEAAADKLRIRLNRRR